MVTLSTAGSVAAVSAAGAEDALASVADAEAFGTVPFDSAMASCQKHKKLVIREYDVPIALKIKQLSRNLLAKLHQQHDPCK